jgi:hypothetical protein
MLICYFLPVIDDPKNCIPLNFGSHAEFKIKLHPILRRKHCVLIFKRHWFLIQ